MSSDNTEVLSSLLFSGVSLLATASLSRAGTKTEHG